jgi:hypothetical protein
MVRQGDINLKLLITDCPTLFISQIEVKAMVKHIYIANTISRVQSSQMAKIHHFQPVP